MKKIFLQFIFAVIAVQLFNGRFQFCTDLSRLTAKECQGEYFVVEGPGPPRLELRKWDIQDFHYDDVMEAMLTLYAVQSGEGWPTYECNEYNTFRKSKSVEFCGW